MAELGLAQQKINILSHDYGDTVALELLYRLSHESSVGLGLGGNRNSAKILCIFLNFH